MIAADQVFCGAWDFSAWSWRRLPNEVCRRRARWRPSLGCWLGASNCGGPGSAGAGNTGAGPIVRPGVADSRSMRLRDAGCLFVLIGRLSRFEILVGLLVCRLHV